MLVLEDWNGEERINIMPSWMVFPPMWIKLSVGRIYALFYRTGSKTVRKYLPMLIEYSVYTIRFDASGSLYENY